MGSGIGIVQALKKYGKESFRKDILRVCKSEEEAYKCEREIIEERKAYSDRMYYNIAFGGLGNTHDWKPTKEAILKGIETKKRNGTETIGERNGMFGKYNHSRCTKIVVISRKGDVFDFPSVAEASRKLNIPYQHICRSCWRGNTTTQKEYFFMYMDDYEKIDDKLNFISATQRKLNQNKTQIDLRQLLYDGKTIYQIDIETLDVINEYKSINIASKGLNINRQSIKRNVLHGANCASKGYSFIFADEYNVTSKSNLYKLYHRKANDTIHNSRPNQKVPIYCVTTNQKFDGVNDAIKYFGLVKGTKIQSVCEGKRQYAGIHHNSGDPLVWQYYEDFVKGICKFYVPANSTYRNQRVEEIVSLYKSKYITMK